jgi:hypothetical protein
MGPEYTWDGNVPASAYPKPSNTTRSMPQNLISATLAQALADEIVADFAAIRAKQAFLMALSAEKKADILKMGTGNRTLEGLIRTAADENAGELAANFSVPGWDQDRAFSAAYRPVVAVVKKLASDMEDTLLAADSDAWTAANDAYSDMKKDGVGPAIDQAREILRQRRRGSGGSTPPTPPTP